MPEDTGKPEPAPAARVRRRFRWLRRMAILSALASALALAAALLAMRHLDVVARWTIEAAFPGIRVRMKSLSFAGFERLEARELVLTSAKDGEELARIRSSHAAFTFDGIRANRIGEIALIDPEIRISPAIAGAIGPGGGGKRAGGAGGRGFPITIGHFVIRNGKVSITKFGAPSPEATLEFSADLKNLGTGDREAEIPHEIVASDIRAAVRSKEPFLELDSAVLRFTAGDLLKRRRITGIEVKGGAVTLSNGLLDSKSISAVGAAKALPQSADQPPEMPWILGGLRVSGVKVTADASLLRSFFAECMVDANLADVPLSASPGPSSGKEQSFDISKLRVTPSGESGTVVEIKKIAVRAALDELRDGRLRELRIVEPDLQITKPLVSALEGIAPPSGRAPASEAQPASEKNQASGWIADQLVCDYGTLSIRGLGAATPDVALKFAFDFRSFGGGSAVADNRHEAVAWDLIASAPAAPGAPLLTIDLARVSVTPNELLKRHLVGEVGIERGRLTVGKALEHLLAASSSSTVSGAAPPSAAHTRAAAATPAWKIGKLSISGLRTVIDDPRPEVSDVAFTMNTALSDVGLPGASAEILGKEQLVEFASLVIRSPVNPEARIFTLSSVFVRFTIAELAQRRIRSVIVLRPVIFLGPDLFIYMERAKQQDVRASQEPADQQPGWRIDHFEVKFGSLVVGGSGAKNVGLPLTFETTIEDLSLDNLSKLKLKAALRVPKQSYDLQSYQLELVDVEGDLRFAYPPEKGENNLVQKLDIRRIRWRQYRSEKAWVAVTFDAGGINGQFGGAAYDGYVTGGFSFFFDPASPWIGWIGGKNVDMKRMTDVIAPQNFQLTGPLEFGLQTDAFGKDIQRVKGDFVLTKPGRMRIGKLDDLLANIPQVWSAFKHSSTRIALEALRDFDYTLARGDFWFVNRQGILKLNLKGPGGSRNFDVVVRRGNTEAGLWQEGSSGGIGE